MSGYPTLCFLSAQDVVLGGVDAFAYVVKCLAQGKGYIDDGDGEWLMFLCF